MTRFFTVLLVAICLLGCEGEVADNETAQLTLLENDHLVVSAPTQINAEQLFDIDIKTSNDARILRARLVGKSMDMGIVPLVFVKQGEGHFIATTLVGRCALPTMQWSLQITWQQNNQEQLNELLIDVKR